MGFQKITESDSVHNNLEKLNTITLLQGINEEDHKVPRAIEAILPQIEKFIDSAFENMKNGKLLGHTDNYIQVQLDEPPERINTIQSVKLTLNHGAVIDGVL